MKKFLAMLLTAGLVISMIPGVAFAEEVPAEPVAQSGGINSLHCKRLSTL